MNELGLKPEDVIVDLHVVRIALQPQELGKAVDGTD
jgi:hypothetical protein